MNSIASKIYDYPIELTSSTEDEKIYAAWIDGKRFFCDADFIDDAEDENSYRTWEFKILMQAIESYASEYKNLGLNLPQVEVIIYEKTGQELKRILVRSMDSVANKKKYRI